MSFLRKKDKRGLRCLWARLTFPSNLVNYDSLAANYV